MPVIACPDCGRDVSTLAPACPHCGRPSPGMSAPSTSAAPSSITEETLWRGGPSWIVLIGKVIMIVAAIVIIPLLARVAASRMPDLDTSSRVIKFGWILVLISVVLQLINLVIAIVRLRSTSYTLTNQRLLIERGFFSKSLNEIDLRTIDDTQLFQTLVDRLLGIGNVTLVASDKMIPTTVLRDIAEPRKVRELIRTNVYQTSHRQLFTRAT